MEPQPPQGAKETRAKLQESRSAIVLSHAQRRRERERAQSVLLPLPYSIPHLLSSPLQPASSKLQAVKRGEKKPRKKQKRASSKVSSLVSLDRSLPSQETRAMQKVGLGVNPKP
jgi:hypothetical protein